MKRIAVCTSGGDAPGMNATIRAVVRRSLGLDMETVGIMHGFAGLVRNETRRLGHATVSDIIHRGGTILRTARSTDFETEDGRERALRNLEGNRIEGLVVIGGGGSAQGALRLHQMGFPVVHVPSTIDNDLVGTDMSIGHTTTVNTVVEAIDRIRDTATSHERIFVIEVMGRDTGFIALHSGLASGAESILIPEIPVSIERDVCRRIQRAHARGKLHSIIVVSEGVGHGFDVANTIQTVTGFETRWTVLGHVQRGGSPAAIDRTLGSRLGRFAVNLLREGARGVQAGLEGDNLVTTPLEETAGVIRQIPAGLYDLAHELAI
ncbi:MAG: ATP-dependent 6-phosphofructokinase [Candidatus Dormibacteria bacterium]